MRINNIKALDYQAQGERLTIPLAETSVEAVLAMNTTLLTVKTDDGDTVEVFAGYALQTVTVDAADPTNVTAVLTRSADDGTAKALDALTDKLTQAEAKAATLEGQVADLQSVNNDVMDALTELAGIVAGGAE
nr:MAG TPA: hypothetical protein [Caudoviricetes sp.]